MKDLTITLAVTGVTDDTARAMQARLGTVYSLADRLDEAVKGAAEEFAARHADPTRQQTAKAESAAIGTTLESVEEGR
jgi:arginyl-tRNA synthetase